MARLDRKTSESGAGVKTIVAPKEPIVKIFSSCSPILARITPGIDAPATLLYNCQSPEWPLGYSGGARKDEILSSGVGKIAMASVPAHILHILAALVWYAGGIVLLVKGGSLLTEAEALDPGWTWPWLAGMIALLLGGLKARFIFGKSIKRNLARIAALDQPRIWQFFSPGFFVALAVMIGTGASLSRLAHGNYPFLIAVAVLDLAIAVALLGSSIVYWQHHAFAHQPTASSTGEVAQPPQK